MVDVNEALTRKIAELSKLELTPEEVKRYTAQLQEVLGYVEQLSEVDTQVEPMVHPLSLSTPMREDVVRPSPRSSNGSPRTLQPAPEVEEGGFKVPPIL